MKEYITAVVTIFNLQDSINKFAVIGWELHSVVWSGENYVIIFERYKKVEKD